MPDIWTTNPSKLREAITSTGAKCGLPSRVLHPRDPEWTCHINLAQPKPDGTIGYDIYIHPIAEYWTSASAFLLLSIPLIAGFLGGRLVSNLEKKKKRT